MSGISAWLLGIAGVVILSVLSELVLPEGQINKYTKVIFSFVILLVIISPLPKLFGKDFDFNKFLGAGSGQLQENYLYQLNINKLSALTQDITDEVKQQGMRNVEVSINANVLCENLEIYSIFVDLCDIEYEEKFGNKDISKAKLKIRNIIDGFSILKDVEVKFDE